MSNSPTKANLHEALQGNSARAKNRLTNPTLPHADGANLITQQMAALQPDSRHGTAIAAPAAASALAVAAVPTTGPLPVAGTPAAATLNELVVANATKATYDTEGASNARPSGPPIVLADNEAAAEPERGDSSVKLLESVRRSAWEAARATLDARIENIQAAMKGGTMGDRAGGAEIELLKAAFAKRQEALDLDATAATNAIMAQTALILAQVKASGERGARKQRTIQTANAEAAALRTGADSAQKKARLLRAQADTAEAPKERAVSTARRADEATRSRIANYINHANGQISPVSLEPSALGEGAAQKRYGVRRASTGAGSDEAYVDIAFEPATESNGDLVLTLRAAPVVIRQSAASRQLGLGG